MCIWCKRMIRDSRWVYLPYIGPKMHSLNWGRMVSGFFVKQLHLYERLPAGEIISFVVILTLVFTTPLFEEAPRECATLFALFFFSSEQPRFPGAVLHVHRFCYILTLLHCRLHWKKWASEKCFSTGGAVTNGFCHYNLNTYS